MDALEKPTTSLSNEQSPAIPAGFSYKGERYLFTPDGRLVPQAMQDIQKMVSHYRPEDVSQAYAGYLTYLHEVPVFDDDRVQIGTELKTFYKPGPDGVRAIISIREGAAPISRNYAGLGRAALV